MSASRRCPRRRFDRRRFVRDERGGAIVEFALIAPLAIALVYGAFEIARALGVQMAMQDAVEAALRTATTTATTDEEALRSVALDRLVVGDPAAVTEFAVTEESPLPGVRRVRIAMSYRFEPVVESLRIGPFTLAAQGEGYFEG